MCKLSFKVKGNQHAVLIVVIWVKNVQIELMVEINSKSYLVKYYS